MGRSPCCDKELGLKKGPWTPEEDELLTHYMHIHGPGNWRAIPIHAGLQRCGKSCRLRWTNYLRPDIIRGKFSFEEENTIIHLHSILGNKWSAIASQLPGRTDNEIKNYWNTHVKKRLLKMGIDPVTHSPRLDLLNLSSIVISAQQNLSNLLGLQALMNPELLRIVSTLNSSSNLLQINPELITMLSQLKLFQENQFVDFQMQNHNEFNQFLNQNNLNNLQESTSRFEQAKPILDFTTFDSIMTSAPMNSLSSTLIEEDEKEISQYSIPENLDFDFM